MLDIVGGSSLGLIASCSVTIHSDLLILPLFIHFYRRRGEEWGHQADQMPIKVLLMSSSDTC